MTAMVSSFSFGSTLVRSEGLRATSRSNVVGEAESFDLEDGSGSGTVVGEDPVQNTRRGVF